MALLTKAPRGTQDILPSGIDTVRFIEDIAKNVAESFGYSEIRTPVFEHTELFQRSVGETTDVVQKEMYTFTDNGNRSITLRPEGTAGVIRAYLEHGLFNEPAPQRLCYVTSCYRYEKPQAGRLREFYQFGIECVGAGTPAADAEIICVAKTILDDLELKNIRLELNSIGCPECRKNYQAAIREYFGSYTDTLCETCNGRLEKNPMRILDCKSPVCSKIAENAPKVTDFLCDECSEHFEGLQALLKANNIKFSVNPNIVRGLDYYTRTVFEFVSDEIGAQGTVCGGGRYDGLVCELGGNSTPAAGFGMGIERIKLLLDEQHPNLVPAIVPDIYIGSTKGKPEELAFLTAMKLRAEGLVVITDTVGRSIKAQMKYANKIGAKLVSIFGDSEIENDKFNVKKMETGEEKSASYEKFAELVLKITDDMVMESISETDLF
jgi:histidyl-tRNA synthetase